MSALITRVAGNGGGVAVPQKGSGDGFVVKYDTTLRVIITSGIYEVNGTLFNLDADTTHNLTSLASTPSTSFNYIYLDKSASTINTPVFYDETTETVEDKTKNGRYHPTNTEDRLVGVTEKQPGLALIQYFDTQIMSNKLIRQITKSHTLAVGKVPNGLWQSPATESSTKIPVNAIEAAIRVASQDIGAGNGARAAWRMNEGAAIETSVSNSINFMGLLEISNTNFWGPLGPSRNIKIGAGADDDNDLGAFLMGQGYTR